MPKVEVSAPARSNRPCWRAVSGSTEAADERDGQPDRDVDEQHPAPGRPLGEHAAGDQADRPAADRDGREQRDRPQPLAALREHRGQQGQRGRRGERATDALQGPRGEQEPAGGGEAAEQRGGGEDGDAGQERAPPAEQVTGPGAQQQQAAEGERVGVEHPGQLRVGEVQRGLDVGQRDVDDGRVQHDHELAGQDDGEHHAWRGLTAPASANGRCGADGSVAALRGGRSDGDGVCRRTYGDIASRSTMVETEGPSGYDTEASSGYASHSPARHTRSQKE